MRCSLRVCCIPSTGQRGIECTRAQLPIVVTAIEEKRMGRTEPIRTLGFALQDIMSPHLSDSIDASNSSTCGSRHRSDQDDSSFGISNTFSVRVSCSLLTQTLPTFPFLHHRRCYCLAHQYGSEQIPVHYARRD